MQCELTVQLDEETGEHMLEFTDEMMEEVGWSIGDTIKWTAIEDGSYVLSKVVNDWQQLELF